MAILSRVGTDQSLSTQPARSRLRMSVASLTHELVRNRIGNAFSQESLRYVRLTDLRFWLPPEIDASPVALQIFLEAITYLESCQKRLADHFGIESMKHFELKKKLTSIFRRIAPMV